MEKIPPNPVYFATPCYFRPASLFRAVRAACPDSLCRCRLSVRLGCPCGCACPSKRLTGRTGSQGTPRTGSARSRLAVPPVRAAVPLPCPCGCLGCASPIRAHRLTGERGERLTGERLDADGSQARQSSARLTGNAAHGSQARLCVRPSVRAARLCHRRERLTGSARCPVPCRFPVPCRLCHRSADGSQANGSTRTAHRANRERGERLTGSKRTGSARSRLAAPVPIPCAVSARLCG